MFYKYINENYIQPCPKNGRANGRAISNLPRYFTKNPEVAKAEGYKELILVDGPEYDVYTQYLTYEYENTEEAIIQHWIIVDIPEEEEII